MGCCFFDYQLDLVLAIRRYRSSLCLSIMMTRKRIKGRSSMPRNSHIVVSSIPGNRASGTWRGHLGGYTSLRRRCLRIPCSDGDILFGGRGVTQRMTWLRGEQAKPPGGTIRKVRTGPYDLAKGEGAKRKVSIHITGVSHLEREMRNNVDLE